MSEVKPPGKRAQKAQETRRRIRAAAFEAFREQGYGATTLQDVAGRAGVAVQTIYFVFGNKRTLLKELLDVTVAGDDRPLTTMERPWYVDALAAETAPEMVRAYVAGTSAVLERVAPLTKIAREAVASDPEVAALWPEDADPRYTVIKNAATALHAKPGARAELSVRDMADVLYGLLSPELFLLFTVERGWTVERWRDWAVGTLLVQLCSD
ncbi:TetR/AcrR family transcriptional regulator [Actinomadura harenae]|uniref:TetR/AcrR family transcriptional regulator n=1 Tax=Actinomadura harenae TaxID=2483351 RepID=A0A3M2M3A5_9ACTN|nr:TetR/AcrR family transcriptional regulator [Actinomadura harenae]RMI41598.1 TetR/AcrR family transcriptional regulator [Actinomadura harenae]